MITDPSGGSTLDLPEDLQLLRPLGEGQTARVHLAREPALARLVAVKVLRPHVAADPIARRRFEREARSAARISHPHVTRVHRVGRLPGDEPYIVMEYIEGRTVRDILDAQGPMATPVARRILAEVASALEATHDQGIIHRDVRPDNILVENRTGRAVLGDFGIAALLESGSEPGLKLTGAGIRLGDVRYLSPEQIHGWPVTEESDVYSFGVLAYEVLTGEGPHRGHSDQEVISGHLQNNPTPLRELRPELERGTAALIEACLSKDPNHRPRTAELVERLRNPELSIPLETGSVAAFLRELRRRRIYQVLVGYGAVVLAMLGGAQSIYEAFDLPRWSYQALVLAFLAGFPVSLALAWIYDISSTGIERTEDSISLRGKGVALKWVGLGGSVVVAGVAAWLLLVRG